MVPFRVPLILSTQREPISRRSGLQNARGLDLAGGPWLWLPALRPGTTTGGGGGTAHPRLSPRAGLCLHPFAHRASGCGACYPTDRISAILVPAPGLRRRRVYESLQGRPEVGPLPTPRRCHATLPKKSAVRFHRCELRYQPTLTGWCDPRSNPRPQALDTKTYVRSSLIVFSLRATRGAGKTLGQPLSLIAIRPEDTPERHPMRITSDSAA
jgi:hypothetical protein